MTKRLVRLAELINKKWRDVGTFVHPSGDSLRLEQDMGGWRVFATTYFPSQVDLDNAMFVIWGLARLEELGYEWTIRTRANRNGIAGYHLTCARFTVPRGSADAVGKTMAETVFNALYTTLEASNE